MSLDDWKTYFMSAVAKWGHPQGIGYKMGIRLIVVLRQWIKEKTIHFFFETTQDEEHLLVIQRLFKMKLESPEAITCQKSIANNRLEETDFLIVCYISLFLGFKAKKPCVFAKKFEKQFCTKSFIDQLWVHFVLEMQMHNSSSVTTRASPAKSVCPKWNEGQNELDVDFIRSSESD